MREIKFKSYTPSGMVDVLSIDFATGFGKFEDVLGIQFFSIEEFPLLQYTGLKDKNDKEIYEGDIVKIYCRNYTHEGYEADFLLCDIGVIEYSNCMSFEVKMKNDHYSTILLDCKHTGEEFWFEKVGNIYDNPELLGVE